MKTLESIIKKITSERASLMIESMVAMTLVLVGLLGIFSLITRSVSLDRNIHNRFVATYLAAEGIEVIKNIIDTDISIGQQGNNTVFWNTTVQPGMYEVQYNTDRNGLSLGSTGGVFSSTPLKLDVASGMYGYDTGTPSVFKRTIKISNASGGGIAVDAVVKWTEGAKENTINLNDVFTNWRG